MLEQPMSVPGIAYRWRRGIGQDTPWPPTLATTPPRARYGTPGSSIPTGHRVAQAWAATRAASLSLPPRISDASRYPSSVWRAVALSSNSNPTGPLPPSWATPVVFHPVTASHTAFLDLGCFSSEYGGGKARRAVT
eukprot:3272751-Rhodomonas_salina.1